MKRVKKYDMFLIYNILESVLKADDDFIEIILGIEREGDYVASCLVELIGTDIKTAVNFIKTSDNNDDISFVNDGQAQRMLGAGDDPFKRTGNIAKIGRSVRQILSSNNVSITDRQIEAFVNKYKNAHDRKYKNIDDLIRVVRGEDIRFWYLHKNYSDSSSGVLGNSCMRYDECQDYLDIYVENPDVCGLVIYVDEDDKLLGRAILWKLNEPIDGKEFFLDRIYTRHDSDVDKIFKWVDVRFKIFSHLKDRGNYRFDVKLKRWKYPYYPYMDSLYYIYNNNIISNTSPSSDDEFYLHAHETNGTAASNWNYSNRHNEYLAPGKGIWIEKLEDFVKKEETVHSDEFNDDMLKDDAVYNEVVKSWISKDEEMVTSPWGSIPKRSSVKVYTDVENGKYEFWPRRQESTTGPVVSVDTKFYSREVNIPEKFASFMYPNGFVITDRSLRNPDVFVLDAVYVTQDVIKSNGLVSIEIAQYDSDFTILTIIDGDDIIPIGLKNRYYRTHHIGVATDSFVVIKEFADHYSIPYKNEVVLSGELTSYVLYESRFPYYNNSDKIKDEKCKDVLIQCHEFLLLNRSSYRRRSDNYLKYREWGGESNYFAKVSFMNEFRKYFNFPTQEDRDKFAEWLTGYGLNGRYFGVRMTSDDGRNGPASSKEDFAKLIDSIIGDHLDTVLCFIFMYAYFNDRDDASQVCLNEYGLSMTERNVLRRSSDNFGKFSESIHNIVSETISINVDVGTRSSDAMSSFKEILPDLKKIVDEKRSQGK